MAYYGIGVTGNTDVLAGLIAVASPDITTREQLETARSLDPYSVDYAAVSFLESIPAVNDATKDTLYIDRNGVAAVKAGDDTVYTLVSGTFVDPEFDPRLRSITIGSLTIAPPFDSAVTSYTATTTNATDAITVVTTSADATATILNGETPVVSGANATWAVGENTVTVTVVCGPFKRVYTIKVTKLDATLESLEIGELTLDPTFDGDTDKNYTATTTNAADTITAVAKSDTATIEILNGTTPVENGAAATWAGGTNVVTITVTDGTAEEVYTVTVTANLGG
jgi:hypothetical protein